MTITKDEVKGHLAAMVTNVIFGLNIPVTKSLLCGWMSPMGYTLTRMLFGLSMFWAISLLRKKETVARRDMPVIAVAGLLGLVATQIAFAAALKFTTPTVYALITALSPIVVLLLSISFLHETITRRDIFGILLGIVGVILIISHNSNGASGSNHALGIGISAAGVISYAAYIIIMRKVSAKYDPATLMKWMFLTAVLVISPFSIGDLPDQRIYSPEATLIPMLLLGFALIFSSLIGFFLMPFALKRIKAATAGAYINMQPIIAAAVAVVVGQDIFSWDKAVAVLFVITGVYIVMQSKNTKNEARQI